SVAAMIVIPSRIAMVNPERAIGLDVDNHSSQDPGSPVIPGVLLPGNVGRDPVKASPLQNDRLAAVIAQERAAIGPQGGQGTNGRLAMTRRRLGNLLGIGPMHFEFFDLFEIGLIDFPSLG